MCIAEVWNQGESGCLCSPLLDALIPCWLPRRLTAGIVDVSAVHFRVTNPTKLPLKLLISFPIWGSSLKCCGWLCVLPWRAIEIFFKKKKVYFLSLEGCVLRAGSAKYSSLLVEMVSLFGLNLNTIDNLIHPCQWFIPWSDISRLIKSTEL